MEIDPKKISIPGLNPRQMYLMDCIWECQSEVQFLEWFCLLAEEDRLQVESLQRLLFLSCIDQLSEESSLLEAQEVLSKFTGGKDVA
jgi:hypothetical protein